MKGFYLFFFKVVQVYLISWQLLHCDNLLEPGFCDWMLSLVTSHFPLLGLESAVTRLIAREASGSGDH